MRGRVIISEGVSFSFIFFYCPLLETGKTKRELDFLRWVALRIFGMLSRRRGRWFLSLSAEKGNGIPGCGSSFLFLITYLPTYERDEYIAALTRIVSGSTRRHGDERCVVNSDRFRHGRNIIVSTLRLLIGIPDYYLVGYVVYCVFIAGRQAGSL
jgi:hypothetical protein